VLIDREKDAYTLGMKFVLSFFHTTLVSAKRCKLIFIYLPLIYSMVAIKLIYIENACIYVCLRLSLQLCLEYMQINDQLDTK
jgi:hypothetical protein